MVTLHFKLIEGSIPSIMSNRVFNINLGYQKDRNCTVFTTNTLNGLLNPVFIISFLKKTVLFFTKTVMVIVKRTVSATTTVMVVTKRTVFATTTVVVTIKTVMVATKRTVFAATTVMVVIKTVMVAAKRNVFAISFLLFIQNIKYFIACIILLLKKGIAVLAAVIASFAIMANDSQIYVGHISNLKGYNKYADWFRTQW